MSADYCVVPISQMDVLMEDFSAIWELIRNFASDRDRLLSSRNTWEVYFTEYDEDPREIPEIPEVVNWIEQSVEAGIPWFYFMRTEPSSAGLLTFMCSCGAQRDPEHPEQYNFVYDKIMPFIRKNLDNLAEFADQYDIPLEIGRAATDDAITFIQNVLQGGGAANQAAGNRIRAKQLKEAGERLSALEKLYGLNPNVKKYFADGKLYYSYLTADGYMGSIDTIDYDKRYAALVKKFEEETDCVVYHVIEHRDTIAALFVSDDIDRWQDERPTDTGIAAWVVNVKTNKKEYGYIKVDCLQGALYRKHSKVYSSMPSNIERENELSDIDTEVVERLEILKNAGIVTDLDITKVYVDEDEICCSIVRSIFGEAVGIVDRISINATYQKLYRLLSDQTSKKLYFLMGSREGGLAFLYLSEDFEDWEEEKLDLEEGMPMAIVIDLKKMSARFERIEYEMLNGGPVFTKD